MEALQDNALVGVAHLSASMAIAKMNPLLAFRNHVHTLSASVGIARESLIRARGFLSCPTAKAIESRPRARAPIRTSRVCLAMGEATRAPGRKGRRCKMAGRTKLIFCFQELKGNKGTINLKTKIKRTDLKYS